MHSAHQAHLVQGASSVCAATVRFPDHFLKLDHRSSLNVRMAAQHTALDHQVGMVLGKVVDKIGHILRCTVHNAHDVASNTGRIFVECFLEEIFRQSHHVSWLKLTDFVPVKVQYFTSTIGVHFPAHKASQAHVSKLQGSRHPRDEGPRTDHHSWRAKGIAGSRRRSRVAAAVPLLFTLDAHIAQRSTLAPAPAATASTPAASTLHRRERERG